MKAKLILLTWVSLILLVGCGGDVSEENEAEIIQPLYDVDTFNEYIEDDSFRLSKGDLNKDLGVIEYIIFGDVNKEFEKLTDGEKHYFAETLFNTIENQSIECSGKNKCRITSINLMYYDDETGSEMYTYYEKYGNFMIGSEIVNDYDVILELTP